jgi:hypothetical protein
VQTVEFVEFLVLTLVFQVVLELKLEQLLVDVTVKHLGLGQVQV